MAYVITLFAIYALGLVHGDITWNGVSLVPIDGTHALTNAGNAWAWPSGEAIKYSATELSGVGLELPMLATTDLNTGNTNTLVLTQETKLYMLRSDQWRAVEVDAPSGPPPDDWVDVDSGTLRSYLTGFSPIIRIRTKTLPAGTHIIDNDSAFYLFEEQSAASANGDPHLVLAHGGRADFRGTDGGLYNFLSSKDASLNVMTELCDFELHAKDHSRHKLVHGSFLTQAHFVGRTAAGRTVRASYFASKISFRNAGWMNGTVDDTPAFSLGAHGRKEIDDIVLSMDYSSLHVLTPEWAIVVTPQPIMRPVKGPTHRLDLQIQPRVAEADLAVPPHGIIGQSWDGDDKAINGKQDVFPERGEFTTSAMAEGAIEGTAKDYLLSSRFSTDFKFSRYGKDTAQSRNVSSLDGALQATPASPRTVALATEKEELN